WSRDGAKLAVGQRGGEVLLFDTATWKEKFSLKGSGNPAARYISFSQDGGTLAVGEESGKVRLWDTATGKESAELPGPGAGVHSVAFSPDGSMLAAPSRNTARLTAGEVWLYKKGKDGKFTHFKTLKGHKKPLLCCAWSADGKRLASG